MTERILRQATAAEVNQFEVSHTAIMADIHAVLRKHLGTEDD